MTSLDDLEVLDCRRYARHLKQRARNLMKRLCDEADVDVDGDHLKPHGARRGLGHELYANGHAELARSALRHASIETSHKSYSDIEGAETAEQVDDLLGE